MGYEYHITRAEHWAESTSHPIAAEEWLRVVEGDEELRIEPEGGAYFAVWSRETKRYEQAWFDWYEGEVFTKNPDDVTLAKLFQLASRLRGIVQGDDGEVYFSAESSPGIE